MFLIKFSLSFLISFFILAFPLNNKPIFHYLYNAMEPYTSGIFKSVKNKATDGWSNSKQVVTKMFANTAPPSIPQAPNQYLAQPQSSNNSKKPIHQQDQVSSKHSAMKRSNKVPRHKVKPLPTEVKDELNTSAEHGEYTVEEQELLQRILNEAEVYN